MTTALSQLIIGLAALIALAVVLGMLSARLFLFATRQSHDHKKL